ncbi:MAG: 5'/3'-nucleotidase SurE [Acidobacteriota bacterium]|nr:5'/3'-nucleotidase SurE [Acidobacteriota bacterium]
MKSILLTNDDGIDAEGLKALKDELCHLAHITVVAPDQERSAVSHGLTIRTRVEIKEVGDDSFSISGTPADCVICAFEKILVKPPDMVVSGINHGSNLGDDIMYSGTVAGAREAARYGVPAVAISQDYENGKKIRFNGGSEFIHKIIKIILDDGLDGETLLNVNIPAGKIRGMKITRHGCTMHQKHLNTPNGEGEDSPGFWKNKLILDKLAVRDGYVSVTPLERDQTDYTAVRTLTRIFV